MKRNISGTGLRKKYERISQGDGPKEQYQRGWLTRKGQNHTSLFIVLIHENHE